MRRTRRLSVLLLTLPFMAGCFTVNQVPVPRTLPEREALNIRGMVIADGDGDEVVRFDEVLDATWTPSSLSIVGSRDDENGRPSTETRLVQITELRGLLVRQIDAGPTSAIVGGVIVGAVAAIAFIVNGRLADYQGG